MAPETGTAILVLTAFVLPGFITLRLRERIYVVPGEVTPFERLLSALTYSAGIYAMATFSGWWFGDGLDAQDLADFYRGEKSLGQYLLVASAGLFLLPALIAIAGGHWQGSTKLRPGILKLFGTSAAHSTPSGWDEFFGSGRAALVRATLVDARVLGGYYGSCSLAGYQQQHPDLYLEARWELDDDGWFKAQAPATEGL